MSDFINTIEALGDDAVVDSIINKTITEFKDDTIETIGAYAFYGCADLTYVSMPNANTLLSYAFENCSALIDFDLPLVEKFDYYSFHNCTSLTTALTEENLPSATILNSPFNGCTSIEVIDLPKVTTCKGTFGGKNSKLISVNLPNAVHTYNNTLSFNQSPNLETVLVPKLTKIGEYGAGVFQYCYKLTNTDFSSLEHVGTAAFDSCEKLQILDFPKVKGIVGFNNFIGAWELIALILRNPDTVCTLANANALSKTPIADGTGYIYVPRALLSDADETKDYRRATNWIVYAEQFRALEDYTVDGTTTGALDEAKCNDIGNGDTSKATLLYNWDFTQSLTDTVSGQTVTLSHSDSGSNIPTHDTNGVSFNAPMQYMDVGAISLKNRIIEIDVAEFDFKGITSAHIRLLMNDTAGHGALIWNKAKGWASYGSSWSNPYGDVVTGTTKDVINYFNGKTIKLDYIHSGMTPVLYVDNTLVGVSERTMKNYDGHIYIGASPSSGQTQATGNQCYNMTISGIRIYDKT